VTIFGLRVDAKYVRQHFGDDGVEFARDVVAHIEVRERFDQTCVFIERNTVLFCNRQDLLGGDAAPDGDDLRRFAR